ncbi:MAG: DUF1732 domain-containing protein [Candidatus Hydrothermales bacterium]
MIVKSGIKSMTGASTVSLKESGIHCKAEIISLNSKGSEFKVFISPEIPGLEAKVREFLSKYLRDGKFIVKVNFVDTGIKLKINKKIFNSLKTTKGSNFLFAIDPFKIPGLINFVYPEKKIWKILKKILKKSVFELEKKRLKEGEEIKRAILKEIDKIKLNLKGIDPSKINEEVIRIKSHLKNIREITKAKKGPWGKRVDFYGQEILKEANTITQKTEDLNVVNSAIKIKECADNIRELSRNLV